MICLGYVSGASNLSVSLHQSARDFDRRVGPSDFERLVSGVDYSVVSTRGDKGRVVGLNVVFLALNDQNASPTILEPLQVVL